MAHDLHEQNRKAWNLATRAHNAHKLDQAGFLKSGGSTLFPEELDLLGDLAGKRLVHLLCNAGQDTLSLASHGADVLGVDISDEAIAFARQLSTDSGIRGEFVRSDVYDWLQTAPEASADLVFSSYGWQGWLSDLPTWAKGVARVLKPGGRFVGLEFNTLIFSLTAEGQLFEPFRDDAPLHVSEGIGDYVAGAKGALSPSGHVDTEPFENPEHTWEFLTSDLDLIGALLGAGLVLERVEQWPYSNGCDPWGCCTVDTHRRMWPPEAVKSIPMMYGLTARRPEG